MTTKANKKPYGNSFVVNSQIDKNSSFVLPNFKQDIDHVSASKASTQ